MSRVSTNDWDVKVNKYDSDLECLQFLSANEDPGCEIQSVARRNCLSHLPKPFKLEFPGFTLRVGLSFKSVTPTQYCISCLQYLRASRPVLS